LLRNVRNIVHAGASNIHKVYDILRDPDEVKRSKLLPFQFFSAYRVAQTELQQAGSALLDALNDAIETSVANIPALPGKTFMTADMSASMTWTYVSEKSSVHCGHIAALMMAMAHKICEQSITSVFADSFKVVNVSTRSGILDNMNVFLRQDVGSSTHLYKAVEWLLENQIKVDRIIVFSDMQAYGGDVQRLMERYRKEANRDVWVHSFDLSGYGTQLFAGKNINLMSGWSDKALQFIRLAEEGADSLVKTIESYR
jgi:60 kDa SS-A/Ro ribonucleoprotein